MFKIFHQRFVEGFGIACEVIGPPQAIAAEVLEHDPLSVALLVLHIEWMSQRHYIESVRDDGTLDPLFRSLLKHHWIEEAQHAKLDMLIIEALAAGRDEAGIGRAIDGYIELGAFLDGGLKVQVELNLDALERASGRVLAGSERDELALGQLQALRWTYIGSGMTHPKFAATLAALSPTAAQKIADLAPTFC